MCACFMYVSVLAAKPEWDRTQTQCRRLGRRHSAVKPRNFAALSGWALQRQETEDEREEGRV